MSLLLKNIALPLGAFTLEVDAEIRGGITVVFGPSGAGKTSLLNLIAGLARPCSAFIQLDGRILTDTSQKIFVPPRRRAIGYVPQDLALFPHLSVRHNLLYGRRREASPRFDFDRVSELLDIQPLIKRQVNGLSGGEQQRIALARALLASPRLLLLDEPLASLDGRLKSKIIPYLIRIRDEFRLPMLYVTHDRHETLSLADQMIVLVDGKIAQTGTAPEVFGRPANLAVAGVVAVENVQAGRILKNAKELVLVAVGEAVLMAIQQNLPPTAEAVHVCIRAEEVILTKDAAAPSSARNRLPCTVRALTPSGPLVRVDLDCGFPLAALLTRQACEELELRPGSSAAALIKAPHVHLVPRAV